MVRRPQWKQSTEVTNTFVSEKDSRERKLGEDSSAVLLNGVKDPIGSMQLLGA